MNKVITLAILSAIFVQAYSSSITINGMTITPSIVGTDLLLKIQGTNSGYIGLGFGKTMTNTDMIMVAYMKGQVQSEDFFSTGQTAPSLDDDTTGANNSAVTGTYTDGVWDIIVTRPIAATDSTMDTAINTTGEQDFAVALGASFDVSAQHSSVEVGSFNLASSSKLIACLATLLSFFMLVF